VILDKEIKVLFLDDQAYQLKFAKFFLEKFDDSIKIEGVTSPKIALKRLMVEDYDLVVSDYMMDEMSGIEFAEKLRAFSDIPIIIYTGYGSEEIAESAFAAGIDDYIKKESGPGHFKVLLNRIRVLTEKQLAEGLYKEMVESCRDGIFILSGDDVVYANRSLINRLGCDDLDCPVIRTVGEATNSRISELSDKISENQGYFLFDLELNIFDKTLTFEVSLSSFYYFDNLSYLCYLRDNKNRTID
jgi:CheY-like chemotaxis protein